MAAVRLHATAVAFDGEALLLVGPSGSGKSDLALRLIDAGGTLVADDQLFAAPRADGRLHLHAPERIAGLMEVRGLGLIAVPHAPATAALLLDLALPPARLPEPAFRSIAGVRLPLLGFAAFEASAVIKARRALWLAASGRLWCGNDE